jgi:hypothetical protein
MLLACHALQEPPTCNVFFSLTSGHCGIGEERDLGESGLDVPGQELSTGDTVCGKQMNLYHQLADGIIHSGCFRESV